jgi:UDP-glucose 4-epimerase
VAFRADEMPRRPGDPAAIVAGAQKVRSLLGWKPEHDDLNEIVQSAYEWERHLMTRNR